MCNSKIRSTPTKPVGRRIAGGNGWTAVTPLVTVFLIVASRGTVGAKQLLGQEFDGITGSDRWSAYNWLDVGRRQLCWAHLARDFQAFVERKGESATIGQLLLKQTGEAIWSAARAFNIGRDGELYDRDFDAQMNRASSTMLSGNAPYRFHDVLMVI